MIAVVYVCRLFVVEICRDSVLQLSYKHIIHVAVAIRNMETDDALADELLAEPCAQPLLVAFFHYEDDVGPADMPWRHANTRTLFSSGRAREMPINPIEEVLGSQAPSAILAANEEELHWYARMSSISRHFAEGSCLARLPMA